MWSTTASGHRVALIIIVEVDTIRTRCQQNGEMSLGTHGEILVLARCAEKKRGRLIMVGRYAGTISPSTMAMFFGSNDRKNIAMTVDENVLRCCSRGHYGDPTMLLSKRLSQLLQQIILEREVPTLFPAVSCFSSLSLESWPRLDQEVDETSWRTNKITAAAKPTPAEKKYTHTRSRAIQKPRGGITTSFSWIIIQKTTKKTRTSTQNNNSESCLIYQNGGFRNPRGFRSPFETPFPMGRFHRAPLRPPTQLRLCKWIL